MRDAQATVTYLKDYQPSSYFIDSTQLCFRLDNQRTKVTSRLAIRRNPNSTDKSANLCLHGEQLTLEHIEIDGDVLSADRYQLSESSLTIVDVPESFELLTEVTINPESNKALEGLYLSDGMFCTQCEAEGFRRITFYIDRPDVMSVFTTRIEAPAKSFPVLLSNGNKIAGGVVELPNNHAEKIDGVEQEAWHYVEWHDPFPKPSYLFALVGGQLQCKQQQFRTMSGREVSLQLFVEEKDLDKCDHALQSLINAMRWDEQIYGREYDLDVYMIVAVDFFNMGAMENKGLNIFNTSCVLAHSNTQTDQAFQRVEAVVAHEYFHNWSGNRVTCRDWFQLSLKEGFTVFRDAEFSADMNSRGVKRIDDVELLQSYQFVEDAGPMSHPVRPDSYMEISNFYTLTVYEKGAEVVRMIHSLLGSEKFRCGSDLYFDRHDGQAVTCEDFISAMEDASGVDLTQFRRWYSQAGTPLLQFSDEWDASSKRYILSVTQSSDSGLHAEKNKPYFLPVALALFNDAGDQVRDEVLTLKEKHQKFVFDGVDEIVTPSLMRGFSAPVRFEYDYSEDQLLSLLRHETDAFAQWNASQQYMMQLLSRHIDNGKNISAADTQQLTQAFMDLINKESTDLAVLSRLLILPSFNVLIDRNAGRDFDVIVQVRESLLDSIASDLHEALLYQYRRFQSDDPYEPSAEQCARRGFKNTCLAYLMRQPNAECLSVCEQQYWSATNMTDRYAALEALVNCPWGAARTLEEETLNDFFVRYRDESLVVNQWFSVQAACRLPDTLQRVKSLLLHEAYDSSNPNKVRALLGAFVQRNMPNFHTKDGLAYQLLAEQVIDVDARNPQLASRLVAPLTQWRRFDVERQSLMKENLSRIFAAEDLSKDLFEVVSKSLKA